MMKTWVWLLLAGFGWCAFFTGLLFGGIGIPQPAYALGLGEVIVGALVIFIPFILGIHTGVSYMRECEAKKVTL